MDSERHLFGYLRPSDYDESRQIANYQLEHQVAMQLQTHPLTPTQVLTFLYHQNQLRLAMRSEFQGD